MNVTIDYDLKPNEEYDSILQARAGDVYTFAAIIKIWDTDADFTTKIVPLKLIDKIKIK